MPMKSLVTNTNILHLSTIFFIHIYNHMYSLFNEHIPLLSFMPLTLNTCVSITIRDSHKYFTFGKDIKSFTYNIK